MKRLHSDDPIQSMRAQGYALLQPDDLAQACDVSLAELSELEGSWDGLPRDAYLRDGGRYRYRRHSCFV